jgi:hypothetical protein
MSIIYSECVCVCLYVFGDLFIQHAKEHASYYIVICVLSGSTTFFQVRYDFRKKLLNMNCGF